MTLPAPFAGIDDILTRHLAPREIPGDEPPLINLLRKGWPSIALGIILAGGLYPMVVAFAATLLMIHPVTNPPTRVDLVEAVFMSGFVSVIGGVIGLVWANAVVVATLPAMLLVVWSLELRGSIVRLGAFWGGVVGLTALLPVVQFNEFPGVLWPAILFGPCLTTVFGQAGGAWGGRGAIQRMGWYERCLKQASVLEDVRVEESAPNQSKPTKPVFAPKRFQFGIRHMMWGAVWLSLLLSLMQVVGIPLEAGVTLLLGWLVYQGATLWIGGLFVKWLGAWSANRREQRPVAVPRGTTGRADAACAFHVERLIGRSLPDDVTREVVSRETGEPPEGLGTGG